MENIINSLFTVYLKTNIPMFNKTWNIKSVSSLESWFCSQKRETFMDRDEAFLVSFCPLANKDVQQYSDL